MMKRLLGLILAAALALPLAAGAQWGSIYSARHNAAGGGFTGAGDTVSGATSGGIPYFSSTTGWASSALLGASAVVLGGGAGTAPFTDITNLVWNSTNKTLQVGSGSTTSTGWILGYSGTSGDAALCATSDASCTVSTARLYSSGVSTVLNSSGAGGWLFFQTVGTTKGLIKDTAGEGPAFTGGTATTDVAALSVTRTNNNAAVVKGVEIVYTDTTSAAGFLPFSILGGAVGSTNLMKLEKAGKVTFGGEVNGVGIVSSSYVNAGSTISVGTTLTSGAGTPTFQLNNATGLQLGSGMYVGWGGTTNYGAPMTSVLSQISSGVVGVGLTAQGQVTGQLHAASLQSSLGTALTLTGGAIGMSKMTASASAPGASGLKLEVICGTNAGSAKIIAAAGTSATAVTVIDNIGSGVSGC